MVESAPTIVTCAVMLEQGGALLLVQEAAAEVRGKWNQPAGHLEAGEAVTACAHREAKEESGYDVELTGLQAVYIYSAGPERRVNFCFRGRPMGEPEAVDPKEIMATQWFTKEELRQFPGDELRHALTRRRIEDWLRGKTGPLDLVVPLD